MSIDKIIEDSIQVSSKEVNSLWKEYFKNNDVHIKTQLVEQYLPLVAIVAKKTSLAIKKNVTVEELLSIGVIGLHSAIKSYNQEKNSSFEGYAYKRIQGSILDEMRVRDHLTRTQRTNYKKVCEVIKNYSAKYNENPSPEKIAELADLKANEVQLYLGVIQGNVNLDDSNRDGTRYSEIVPDTNSNSPIAETDQKIALEDLRKHFRRLDEREQKILFLKHHEDLPVKEIALVLEISEGRISQIYKIIIEKLRKMMLTEKEQARGVI